MRTARRTIVTAAGLTVVALLATPQPGAAAEQIRCAAPAAGQEPQLRDPGEVGMDPAAVDEAIRFGMGAGAHTVQLYRHGCLVGAESVTGSVPMPLFSASKGVTAVAVGRAVTLGLFGIDDPLGRFFPDADAAHAAITVRQVLNQTTGLQFSWAGDITATEGNVEQALSATPEFAPGTTFQYAQNVLGLLPAIIERTSGVDYQQFVQDELMGPLGIERADWIWLRGRDDLTSVAGGLSMRPTDLARFGELLLRGGSWNGRPLVDPDFIRQGTTPTAANGGYGFLWWLNSGETYRGVNVPDPVHYQHRVFPGLPADAYAFAGALGQFVVMIPSRDLVIVRMGVPTTVDPNNLTAALTSTSNPDNGILFGKAVAAIVD
ncbi:serine hydrolase domain-containing protein [Nocardia rhizosphaerae]|uniref:Serine hydrolase domain-containing protein n=1 Tax=Nocardia rhizosphaerae TaxID=1691571 RepID=A0ABV8LB56_9NOCA